MRDAFRVAALVAATWISVGPRSFQAAAPQAREVFTPSELEYAEGGALYRNRCMQCHGPDGVTPGAVDVAARSQAMSEDDLLRTIIGGIPGTEMRASGLTAFEAGTLAAYLGRIAGDRIGESEGDAARGRILVEGRGGCLGCHAIGGQGSIAAPDLTRIGGVRRSAQLRDSLLDPDAEVRIENRYVDAHLLDGSTVRGRLLNQDSFSLQILGMDERLRAISKSDLDELEFIDSPMPSYGDRLTPQELNDIVRYLTTLR